MINETIIIKKLSDFSESVNSHKSQYVYRGHSDSGWKLEPTFERILGDRFELKRNYSLEEYLINKFESTFHLYNKEENIKPKSRLEWFALMQHYGVPTRLLDFTLSPYVALYFAIENFNQNSTKEFSIVAINWKAIQKKSSSIIKKNSKDFNDDPLYLKKMSDIVYDKYLNDEKTDVIWLSEPNILNKRLDLQQGTFLFTTNSGMKLETKLDSIEYSQINRIEYFFDPRLFKDCYKLLEKMNINGKTIYGDLGGLGNSLRDELKSLSVPLNNKN